MEKEFKGGDIIVFGSTIGHVYSTSGGIIEVDAYFTDTEHSHLAINRFGIDAANTDVRHASNDERAVLQEALMRKGYKFVSGDAMLRKCGNWGSGCWIEVELGDRKVSGVTTDFEFPYFTMMAEEDGDVSSRRLSVLDVEVVPLKISHRKSVQARFERAGYLWDSKRMMLVPKRPRARQGQVYWSITDRFTIRAEQDTMTDRHSQHYYAGNYFLSPEEANRALQVLLDYLRDNAHD